MTRHLSQLGVVVPTFGDRDALADCLSELRSTAAAGARVVLVDGGRFGRTAPWARASYPFIRSRSWADLPARAKQAVPTGARPAPLGGLLHLGVEALGRRAYLAIVDPSARPTPTGLAALVAALEEDPGGGAAAPALHSTVQRTTLSRGPGLVTTVVRRDDWELVGGVDAALARHHLGEDLSSRLARRGRRWLSLESSSVRCVAQTLDTGMTDAERESELRADRTRFLARHGTGVSGFVARGKLALTRRAPRPGVLRD